MQTFMIFFIPDFISFQNNIYNFLNNQNGHNNTGELKNNDWKRPFWPRWLERVHFKLKLFTLDLPLSFSIGYFWTPLIPDPRYLEIID